MLTPSMKVDQLFLETTGNFDVEVSWEKLETTSPVTGRLVPKNNFLQDSPPTNCEDTAINGTHLVSWKHESHDIRFIRVVSEDLK